ncbi:hypothetical protein ERJ70_02410 [Sediminibacillus dalangtanensis]|uniref:Beta-lactamase inhibitor (BLIP) n=1 Tax=Sediminibacillus dalangtanensis TaxID=2729421 RepID=A0ABX7VP73_9BACI|nr:hypothetical protein [Sediminibacillus dalangtanensis]QTM98268.1 hypothetical protein ERJ70_02410 [Sediminibacillus dalangtanensis]
MQNIFILALVSCTILICGCESNEVMDYYEETKSTDLSEIAINTLTLNDTDTQVKEVLGEPDFTETVEQPPSTYYLYGDDEQVYDLDVRLVDGKVKRFFLSKNNFSSGIGDLIGKPEQAVYKLFGDDYYERTDTGTDVIGYFDKPNKINMEFTVDETVTGIIVSEIE